MSDTVLIVLCSLIVVATVAKFNVLRLLMTQDQRLRSEIIFF